MARRGEPAGARWSDPFGRSSIAEPLFTVRRAWRDRVTAAVDEHVLASGQQRQSGSWMGADSYETLMVEATSFPYGYLLEVNRRGWNRIGDFQSGVWLIGFRGLREACRYLAIQPPARPIRAEQLETPEVFERLYASGSDSDEQVWSKMRRALGLSGTWDLHALVRHFYGPEGVRGYRRS